MAKASAMISNANMPTMRIPIHGMNRHGVIAWTQQQYADRTFELIPWHRVDSVTITLEDLEFATDYSDYVF